MKVYAGIGSRETPADVLAVMRNLAYELSGRGWTLRSGGAPGADTAFADGAWDAYFANSRRPKPEVYLPWPSFAGIRPANARLSEPQPEAFEIARRHHPAWDRLRQGGQKLHARNVHQVLGPDVTAPVLSSFIICWTPGGEGGGGTGQALRIARSYDVPIFDLARPSDFERVTGGLFS